MGSYHWAALVAAALVVGACGSAAPTQAVPTTGGSQAAAQASASEAPTPEPTDTPTAGPTATPEQTPSPTPSPSPTPALKSIEELITGKQPSTTASRARAAIAAALKLPAAKSSSTYADAGANVKDCTSSGLPFGDRAAACYFAAKFAFGLYVATGNAAFYDTALRVHSYAVHDLPRDSVDWIDSRLRGQFN